MRLVCLHRDIFSVFDLNKNRVVYNRAIGFRKYIIQDDNIYAIDDDFNIIIISLLSNEYKTTIYNNKLEIDGFIVNNNMMYFYIKYELYRINLTNGFIDIIHKSRSIIVDLEIYNSYMVIISNNGEIKLFQNDIILWSYKSVELSEFIKNRISNMNRIIYLMGNGNIILSNYYYIGKNTLVIYNTNNPRMEYIDMSILYSYNNNMTIFDITNISLNRIKITYIASVSSSSRIYRDCILVIGTSSIRIISDSRIIEGGDFEYYNNDNIKLFTNMDNYNTRMTLNNISYSLNAIKFYTYQCKTNKMKYLQSRYCANARKIIRYNNTLLFNSQHGIYQINIPKSNEYGLELNEIFHSNIQSPDFIYMMYLIDEFENNTKINSNSDLIIDDSFDILDMF